MGICTYIRLCMGEGSHIPSFRETTVTRSYTEINIKVWFKIGIIICQNFSRYGMLAWNSRERRHLILSLADYKCYFFERSIILRQERSSPSRMLHLVPKFFSFITVGLSEAEIFPLDLLSRQTFLMYLSYRSSIKKELDLDLTLLDYFITSL